MQTEYGHLTYCSNIHPGVSWEDHFNALKENVPYIRKNVAGDAPLALGLRCSNEASLELEKPERLAEFSQWLTDNKVYTFCFNGFPYGSFHNSVVKDQVHSPDWTTTERRDYTKRLFKILAGLIPAGMHGGVSTPPLSYRYWWTDAEKTNEATSKATHHILEVVDFLIDLEKETGKFMHLDIEPEPDGILNNGEDFFRWYRETLLSAGIRYLFEKRGLNNDEARDAVFRHVQLCYDICHFAVSYESPASVFQKLKETGIRVGRIQVSAALQIDLEENKNEKLSAIAAFNEPVYLHQVVARTANGQLIQYPDLDQALADNTSQHVEWRVHYHVPLFMDQYGVLNSTQSDIRQVLELLKKDPVTPYLEVETYTWGVLPSPLQLPISDSIARELNWVKSHLSG